MDRRARASYQAAHDDLRGRGCAGGGYRLGAADGDDYPLAEPQDRPSMSPVLISLRAMYGPALSTSS